MNKGDKKRLMIESSQQWRSWCDTHWPRDLPPLPPPLLSSYIYILHSAEGQSNYFHSVIYINLSVHLSICLSVNLSICQSVHLSIYLVPKKGFVFVFLFFLRKNSPSHVLDAADRAAPFCFFIVLLAKLVLDLKCAGNGVKSFIITIILKIV